MFEKIVATPVKQTNSPAKHLKRASSGKITEKIGLTSEDLEKKKHVVIRNIIQTYRVMPPSQTPKTLQAIKPLDLSTQLKSHLPLKPHDITRNTSPSPFKSILKVSEPMIPPLQRKTPKNQQNSQRSSSIQASPSATA